MQPVAPEDLGYFRPRPLPAEPVHYGARNWGPGTIYPQIGGFGTPPWEYYASARSQSCFSDPKFRYRPRPSENCLFRIRWASSMPANAIAALPKDLKPVIEAHRRLIARWS